MNDRVDAPTNESARLDQLCIHKLRTLAIAHFVAAARKQIARHAQKA